MLKIFGLVIMSEREHELQQSYIGDLFDIAAECLAVAEQVKRENRDLRNSYWSTKEILNDNRDPKTGRFVKRGE